MSYSQAEFIVRYQRMLGKNVFYPMGFVDNGLPTERYVEQTYKINKRKTSRKEFRDLFLKETASGGKVYEEIWRSLGLSVDWKLRYSTIDEHCRRTSQKSFVELYKMGRIYRSSEPVLWDTHFETALAQADLESIEREGKIHDIAFKSEKTGEELLIATTRPELMCACVALYFNPEDVRYTKLKGSKAIVPIFGHAVPILESEDVDKEFGTGLMMCCTFGDGEDVKKWKKDKLETRVAIETNGKMTQIAGAYVGLMVDEARSKIVTDLTAQGFLKSSKKVVQNVTVAERSGVPVEFMMVPQWYIKTMDKKEEFKKRAEELGWYPEFMKVRLDTWIDGLKYDWNISRQRFYGVPVPVWYCRKCGEVILPDEKDLPVDPAEDALKSHVCPKCGATEFVGETDVLDTWATSSMTAMINGNWANSPSTYGDKKVYPASLRVQGHEIIRTWLFYSLIKGHYHTNSLPWKNVMISGWGLNENGKKIAKRDMEQYTDSKTGYNRYNPIEVMKAFGADALRYWSAGSHLGNDFRYSETDVKNGRKLVVKLFNAAKFLSQYLTDFEPTNMSLEPSKRELEDRWIIKRMNEVVAKATEGFEGYDYAVSREAIDKFFWGDFCDDYLEIIKYRFWNKDKFGAQAILSAQITLYEVFRKLLALLAPFIPFITEEIYDTLYKEQEGAKSLHVTAWPKVDATWNSDTQDMEIILQILHAVRAEKTAQKVSPNREIKSAEIFAPAEFGNIINKYNSAISAVARAQEIKYKQTSEFAVVITMLENNETKGE
jgi:valyl-tRNA synthetase